MRVRPLKFDRVGFESGPVTPPWTSASEAPRFSNVMYGQSRYLSADGHFCFYRHDGRWYVHLQSMLTGYGDFYESYRASGISSFPRLRDAVVAVETLITAEGLE